FAAASPLAKAGRPPGVMHCFGGSLELAQRYVELGLLISLPCTITYPKNETTRALAAELPLDALVLETDSPYLPPQSARGERNEPANVRIVAEMVAQVRGCSVEEVAQATTANAE